MVNKKPLYKQTGIEPSPFKVFQLPPKPLKDSVYYVFNKDKTASIYVTDKTGVPIPVGTPVNIPDIYLENVISPGGTLDVTKLGNIVKIDIKQEIIDKINDLQSDKNYVHEQGVPSNIWICNHNLNKKASVTVVNSAEEKVKGKIEYINKNTVKITFNGAFSGEAYFN